MNQCTSNKNCYDTLELAEEALIQNHSRNYHHRSGGPINVYLCDHCGTYHFTSRGKINEKLKDEGVQKKITLERQANYWESKLR